ncbi:MAG: MBL fold metallo-hydrolase [Planctomycetes bacterium]|nr:MBL fold metallo-hydrolase [Planctomycetota bacterium]
MRCVTMGELRAARVPSGSLTVWWLGQAGFVIKSPEGRIAVLDPYLSNSAKAIGEPFGLDLDRIVPPPIAASELVGIDLYAMTHGHADHFDPPTLAAYRAAGGTGPFLAPAETVEKLIESGVSEDEVIMTWPNKVVRVGDLSFRAMFAIPFSGDDLTHVGYLVSVDDGCRVYFTGDTAYHELLAVAARPHRPDVLVTVINPAFRNMGPVEAARLARELDVKVTIPCHYDLFPDNSLPPRIFRTNLIVEGIGDRYRALEQGIAYTYPESAA